MRNVTLRLACITLLAFALAPACTAGGAGDDDDDSTDLDGPSICTATVDCPVGEGCGPDALCHEDGQCTDAADCAAGELCYDAGNDDPAGICNAERPDADPYCRSDGEGACRYECNADGTCAGGGACEDGFCTFDGECEIDDDCTPNHVCEELPDYGIGTCVDDLDPECFDTGDGVCRLACETDLDCLWGGGCDGGYCYASNECDPAAPDCAPEELCYEDDTWGGLCGPPRDE